MEISQVELFYFSPTHTSRQIVRSVAAGIGEGALIEHDLTHSSAEDFEIPASSLALFAVPVYAGKVAPVAMERLGKVRGAHTPAVVLVVYGNRDYEGALEELAQAVTGRGFVPIGAGAFIGEHSYSTPRYPIAPKRPDRNDLEIARLFGCQLLNKMRLIASQGLVPIQVKHLSKERWLLVRLHFIWKVMRMKWEKMRLPATPVTDPALCNGCGRCVVACPVEAIAAGDELHSDPSRCIRCCACVKECRQGARSFNTPFAPILASCCARPRSPQVLL